MGDGSLLKDIPANFGREDNFSADFVYRMSEVEMMPMQSKEM